MTEIPRSFIFRQVAFAGKAACVSRLARQRISTNFIGSRRGLRLWCLSMRDQAFEVLLSAESIKARIKDLSREIESHYQACLGSNECLLVVGVLKGSFIFLADLIREIKLPVEVDFIEVSSYSGMESTGQLKFIRDLRASAKGRHILLVEDIIDTGLTMSKLQEHLKGMEVKDLRLCSLLFKPSGNQIAVKIDHLGFKIDDKFVIGYGLDVDERFRQLKDIVIYKEK